MNGDDLVMPSDALASSDAEIADLLADPATSDWARAALGRALKRDCVDAASDAAIVAAVLERRAVAFLAAAKPKATHIVNDS